MTGPELGGIIHIVGVLISTVSMHAVRIDHEFEIAVVLLQGIDKLEGILEMYVVIPGSVGELQVTARLLRITA